MERTNTLTAQDLDSIFKVDATNKRVRWVWIIILVVGSSCGAALALLRPSQRESGAVQYVTELVERGDLALTVTATGNLKPTNEVIVGSELSGTVLEVLVETNDRVKKGQPLARLDTRKLSQQIDSSSASLDAAKAKVSLAKATVVHAESTLRRSRDLSGAQGGKMISEADMDTAIAEAEKARADLVSADAAVKQAEAQLQANRTDFAKATIAAPIDGTVLSRKIEPGQTVAASFTSPEFFVIAENLERMKLKVAVAEADIGGVKEGQTATFTVDAWPDRLYTAIVRKAAFGSTVTDNVVTYETELEVPNDDLSLRPGMTATVDICTTEVKNVLLVPSSALRFDPEKAVAAAKAKGSPKKSFLQSIAPGPPPRTKERSEGNGNTITDRKKPESRIWTLTDGRLRPIDVITGISNGRVTAVAGEGVTEELLVIVRAAEAPATP